LDLFDSTITETKRGNFNSLLLLTSDFDAIIHIIDYYSDKAMITST